MKILGFIPARKGSKGIPGKNTADLMGRPLIAYTLEAAVKSRLMTDLFISTDDEVVISICEAMGIAVSYRRPPELASDTAPMSDVIDDGLKWLKQNSECSPEAVVILQPTSPFRDFEDIDKAITMFLESGQDTLVSVHKMLEHPYECIKKLGASGKWGFLETPAKTVFRRQDYENDYFYINGAIYIVSSDYWSKTRAFIDEGETVLYEMSAEHGVDIDDIKDLYLAEALLRKGAN